LFACAEPTENTSTESTENVSAEPTENASAEPTQNAETCAKAAEELLAVRG